jgi:hypothetical protein
VPPTRTFPPRRPRVTGTSSLTEVYLDNLTKAGSTPQTGALYNQQRGAIAVWLLRTGTDRLVKSIGAGEGR